MERTEKIPDFMKENKEFFINELPFPVHVKYIFNYIFGNPKALVGWPTISHFDFSCDPKFSSFTGTGYKSHFFQPRQLLKYISVEEGAKALVLLFVKESAPDVYNKIIKGTFIVQLSLF